MEIIRGGLGSGKSRYIFDSIAEKIKENPRKNIIIVPEQFSYKTERQAVEMFGGAGLNNVEVLTFSRLYSRYITNEPRLTPAGKRMIIFEALTRLPEDSLFYGCKDKQGFIDSTASLISELTEYLITPEILRQKAEEVSAKLLKEKLIAVADILEIYLSLTSGRFSDSEEDIARLADFAVTSGEFSDCDFWIDEFSVFLPQHYMIFEALLESGSDLHISVAIDSAESDFYEINKNILYRLRRLGEKAGVSEYKTDDICRNTSSSELAFLKDNLERISEPDFKPWDKPTEDISLFVGKDLYKEVRHTALTIRRMVMEEGYRYRDIAVACGDTEGYSHIIEAVFNDYKIPYFTDTKMSAGDHPVALTVLSAFDIVLENWSYASVFRYLKTGYVFCENEDGVHEISPEGVDLLENYCLKYGIRGKNVWLDDEKWQESQRGIFDAVLKSNNGFSADELSEINRTRELFIAPFKPLYEKIAGRRTVREFAAALFELICDIRLFEGLEKRSAEFDSIGLRNEAEQARRIWNIIIEMLDQAVTVMGEEKCSREDFAGIISAGISAVEISIIPSGLDRVAVSSVDRSRQHDAKVMFLVGAVFGAIPKEVSAEGIFTDTDRLALKEVLAEDGMDIAADTQLKCEMDNFNFLCSLFKVKEKLFISYPAADAEGAVNRPARIISDLFKVFSELTAEDDIIYENESELLYSPESAYGYMLANRKKGGVADGIYRWFEENRPEKLQIIENAGNYKSAPASITPQNAERLYEDSKSYSASRLDEYGNCPFGYFVKYGLKAKEQESWQVQKFDLGSIMHMAIEMYCQRIDGGAESFEALRRNWLELTDSESEKIIDEIIDDIEKRIISGIHRDGNKIRYIMMRLKKIVSRSAERVRKSLSAGEYTAVCYEKKFRVSVNWKGRSVSVNGTIDRVDMAENEEEKLAELRVVDYKTGRKNFSIVSICNRQDIQLVVYAIAAAEMYREGDIRYARADYSPKARAILYNHMRDDFVLAEDEAEGEALKIKNSRPDGLIVLDENGEGGVEIGAAVKMDKSLEHNKKSNVIRVELKADGTPTEASQVTSSSAFGVLCDYVKKAVIEIDQEIFSGIIKICPYSDGAESACEFCDFEEVCLYNERFDEKRGLVKDKNEAMEMMKREVEE